MKEKKDKKDKSRGGKEGRAEAPPPSQMSDFVL